MKESYGDVGASVTGPESWLSVGNCRWQALTGGRAGEVLSLEKNVFAGVEVVPYGRRHHLTRRHGEACADPPWSKTLSCATTPSFVTRESHRLAVSDGGTVRAGKSMTGASDGRPVAVRPTRSTCEADEQGAPRCAS